MQIPQFRENGFSQADVPDADTIIAERLKNNWFLKLMLIYIHMYVFTHI